MSPFRRSREFSLYRQLVFGDRAGAPDQANPLWAHAQRAARAVQPDLHADAEGVGPGQTESETE